jgi:hypothetical protein
MHDRELGWVMGVIDGEGSVLLGPTKSGRSPRLMVPSTDRALLVRLKELAGGYICPRTDKRKHTDWAWTWVLSANPTLDLLRVGWQLLRVPQKRNRAKLLVESWKYGITPAEKAAVAERFFAISDEKLSRKTTSKVQAKEAIAA